MSPEPESELLDLVVVGGLTIDRFADGADAPGGAVMHIARAAADFGLRIGIVTAAGPEPVAAAAIAELRSMADAVEVTDVRSTITFRHREGPGARRLWLERDGGPVALPVPEPDHLATRTVLFAPVGNELANANLAAWPRAARSGAALQGWLRSMHEGAEVRPRPLPELDRGVLAALGQFSLLVASREDLRAMAGDGPALVSTLRQAVGDGPAIVITDGADGLWVQRTSGYRLSPPSHVMPTARVDGVPTVGAGDILAAMLLLDYGNEGWRSMSDDAWARPSMDLVERVLRGRRRPPVLPS